MLDSRHPCIDNRSTAPFLRVHRGLQATLFPVYTALQRPAVARALAESMGVDLSEAGRALWEAYDTSPDVVQAEMVLRGIAGPQARQQVQGQLQVLLQRARTALSGAGMPEALEERFQRDMQRWLQREPLVDVDAVRTDMWLPPDGRQHFHSKRYPDVLQRWAGKG